jgi:chromosome segregation ATPase
MSIYSKTNMLIIVCLLAYVFVLQSCATKGSVRSAVAANDMNQAAIDKISEKMSNDRLAVDESLTELKGQMVDLSQQVADLNKQMKETAILISTFEENQQTTLQAFETLNQNIEQQVGTLGDYKTDYDKTWQEINSIGRKYGEAIRELQNTSDANQSSIEATNLDLKNKTTEINTKIDRLQTDVIGRLENANKDMNNFRKQVADHFETIKASYTNLSEALYAIVKLQYTQFQSVTEEYTRSMNSIEALLPSSTLRSFEPDDSLQGEKEE